MTPFRAAALLAVALCGCATAPAPAPQAAAAPSEPAPTRPTGFKDRALRVEVVDERKSLAESAPLRRSTLQLVTERLKAAGARVTNDAPESLVIVLREFGGSYEGSTPVSCVALSARLGAQSFLPGELRARHCAGEGGVERAEGMAVAAAEEINRSIPSAKDAPGLGKAFGQTLDELYSRLERQPRP